MADIKIWTHCLYISEYIIQILNKYYKFGGNVQIQGSCADGPRRFKAKEVSTLHQNKAILIFQGGGNLFQSHVF